MGGPTSPPTMTYPRSLLERLYEKPSQADQPPHHEATHGSIFENASPLAHRSLS
jgi:hypothetical protein